MRSAEVVPFDIFIGAVSSLQPLSSPKQLDIWSREINRAERTIVQKIVFVAFESGRNGGVDTVEENTE